VQFHLPRNLAMAKPMLIGYARVSKQPRFRLLRFARRDVLTI
jgi:hypothetical protein